MTLPSDLLRCTTKRLAWLPLLRRMHAVADAGIEKAVRAEERRRGARRACRRGCSVCCRHQSDIPALPIELAGLSWHCAERSPAPPARRCARGSRPTPAAAPAPSSSTTPAPCTRCGRWPAGSSPPSAAPAPRARTPITRAAPTCSRRRAGLLARVYREMLPFHGVNEPRDQEEWLERRLVDALAVNLPACDWRSLVAVMDRVTAGN